MNMTYQTHPSRDELAAYLAGKLNAVDSDQIQQHLAACQSCCDLLDLLPTDDTIVAALRQQDTDASAAPDVPSGNTIAPTLAPEEVEENLVMEFVDGENLDEVIRKRGPLPVDEACEYVRQTAEGLQYAHQLGMVHRDIKPHNLMVSVGQASSLPEQRATWPRKDGKQDAYPTIKILDFGLAGFASETAAEDVEENSTDNRAPAAEVLAQLTQLGTMMGTPDYIAPEQAQDAHAADIRADIYSLGCTFYALLTGRVPFGKGSVLDKIKAHTEQDPAPLSDFRDDVPAAVEAILLKMMAKDPAARYQTPQEVVDALRNFIDQRIDERLRDYEAGRPPSKPLGPATGESDDDIRKWYGQVANMMLSVGLINIVTSLVFVSIIVWLALVGEDYRSFATHWVTLVCTASLVPGTLLLTVVGSVRRMESYGRVLFAVLLCMLPTPGAFLGIPMGLVTLFHLLSPDCRRPLGARPQPSLGERILFIALLACPFVLVVAGLVYYMQPGVTAVMFKIEDPSLAVEFQFQRITAENDGRSISIVPDELQRFTIERDGQAMETGTFRLSQGQHATLRIVSADGIPLVVPAKGDVAIRHSTAENS